MIDEGFCMAKDYEQPTRTETKTAGGMGAMSTSTCEPFRVMDDKAAEWCIRKIREAQNEKQRWRDYYAEQQHKIDQEADNSIGYFEALLADYFELVPHKRTKTQESYQLPGGKLVRRQQTPEYQRDETALLPWLRINAPDLIKVTEAADWAAVKKRLSIAPDGETVTTEDGEIIPGIKAAQRPDVFRVEIKGGTEND